MATWPKFLALVVGIFAAMTFFASPVAMAQFSEQSTDQRSAQQVIQDGLCAGVNFKLEGGNCQQNDQSGAEQVDKIVHSVINTLSLVVGIVAVIMIIIGGLRYVTSGGSDTSVTSAKNTILYAIVGLIIVALSQVMVRFVLNKITQ